MVVNHCIIPDYSTYTDAALLELLAGDQAAAFGQLYDRYRQDVFRYALTLVEIPELAEDLVHDVFVRIWEVRHRLEIKSSLRSYLLRTCHNRAMDINRDIAARRQLVDQLVYHYQLSVETEEAYSAQELQRYDALVEEALDTLTPQRRRIYEMCKKEKKSYDEVARELDISPNTVKNHIAQTLAILRQYVRQHAGISVLILFLQKFF